MNWMLSPGIGAWTVIIRLMLAGVFIPEGIQKFVFADILGAGRFERIGIPSPDILAPLVGGFEVICGALLFAGLFTRLAAVPIIVIMIVAVLSTKVPILLGQDFWIFHAPAGQRYGMWGMLHEIRTDWSMLLAAVFVLLSGGGRWSADQRFFNRGPSASRF